MISASHAAGCTDGMGVSPGGDATTAEATAPSVLFALQLKNAASQGSVSVKEPVQKMRGFLRSAPVKAEFSSGVRCCDTCLDNAGWLVVCRSLAAGGSALVLGFYRLSKMTRLEADKAAAE
jgi:hypothetical protein